MSLSATDTSMNGPFRPALAAILLLVGSLRAEPPPFVVGPAISHPGAPDGSAGVSAGKGYFIAACDEDNILRLYPNDRADPAIELLDFGRVLGLPKGECDLEGAARLGDLIYWIGSHGTNPLGQASPNRQILFATRSSGAGAETRLELAGPAFFGLRAALLVLPNAEALGLIAAADLPPRRGGLNIEALCADGQGGLWIGFRSPTPGGKALLLPLTNPRTVVLEKAVPQLGEAQLLDLGGLGLRDMVGWRDGFLLVAGDYRDQDHGAQPSVLYLWKPGTAPVRLDGSLRNLNVEAAVVHGEGRGARLQLLTDEPKGSESFQSAWVDFR